METFDDDSDDYAEGGDEGEEDDVEQLLPLGGLVLVETVSQGQCCGPLVEENHQEELDDVLGTFAESQCDSFEDLL